jgi:hypothetical protein
MKSKQVIIGDLDVFYISYDEPAKEEHWANLMMKFPFAKRVDGVKGFDNAHKECAKQSETERFITIDGDNIVDEKFFDLAISFPEDTDLANSIVSWSAKNMINGLVYGNGGIKCWPVDLVLEMKTHENAEDETKKVDFCWDLNYIQMNNIYSEVYNAGSPFQAFRAGYREGVKMSLDEGKTVPIEDFKKRIWHKNYQRLLTWCNVGADVENGLWACYGARLGCYDVNFVEDYKLENISSFDWFKSYFEEEVLPTCSSDNNSEKCSRTGVEWDYEKLYDKALQIGDILSERIRMQITDPTPETSSFFKEVYTNPPRSDNPLATEKSTGWSGH